jgi:hypothetical protein
MCLKDMFDGLTAFGTIALAFVTAVVAAATCWLAWQAREAIRVQVWLELLKRFDSDEIIQARRRLARQIGKYTPEMHAAISEQVMNFFEDVGDAYERNFIQKDLAYDSFSFHLCRWWEASKAYVTEERKRHPNTAEVFTSFEKLAAIMKRTDVIDAAEMQRFLSDESRVGDR